MFLKHSYHEENGLSWYTRVCWRRFAPVRLNRYLKIRNRWKIYGKTLHIPHTRLTLTTLRWKQNRILLYRPLIDAEYQTSMKFIWLLKPVSKKKYISLLGRCNVYRYLPEVIIYGVLCSKIVSINYWNVIKIFRALFEEIVILCLRASLKGCYFRSWNVYVHRTPLYGG